MAPFGSIESDVGLNTFTHFLNDDTLSFDENVTFIDDYTTLYNQASTSPDAGVSEGGSASQSYHASQEAFSPWLEDDAFGRSPLPRDRHSHGMASSIYGEISPYSGLASHGDMTTPGLDVHSAVTSPSFEDSFTPFDGYYPTGNLPHLSSSPLSFLDHPVNFSYLPKEHFH